MSHPAVFADVVKQLSSRHVLHNHEEVCGGADHLVPTTHACVSGLFVSQLWTFTIIRNINVQMHRSSKQGYIQKGGLTLILNYHSNNKCTDLRGKTFEGHLNYRWYIIHLCFMVQFPLKRLNDFCSRFRWPGWTTVWTFFFANWRKRVVSYPKWASPTLSLWIFKIKSIQQ